MEEIRVEIEDDSFFLVGQSAAVLAPNTTTEDLFQAENGEELGILTVDNPQDFRYPWIVSMTLLIKNHDLCQLKIIDFVHKKLGFFIKKKFI